jgi:predicted site-specific integrase-resolvase
MEDKDRIFLNASQLAKRWQISVRTLERWRYEGTGPAWVKIGGHVLYRVSIVEDFEGDRLRDLEVWPPKNRRPSQRKRKK